MAEATEENPLEEIKEQIDEVIELLNQPHLPVAVVNDEEKPEGGEPDAPPE